MLNPYLDDRNNPYLRDVSANPYFEAPPPQPVYVQQGDTSVPLPVADGPVYAQPVPPPEYSEFGKGLRQGVRSFAPAIDRTQAAVQGALGFEQAAQANLAEAQAAEQRLEQNQALRPRIARFRDAQTAGDYVDWGLYNLGAQAPLMGAMATTGLAGGAVGALAGAGRAVGAASGMLPYLNTTVSETSQRIFQDPNAQGTLQEKSLGALTGGVAQAAVGAVPFARVAGAIARPAASLAGRMGQAALTGAVTEGATEGFEEAIGKLTHQQFNPQVELNSREAWLDYLDAAAGGALVGGAFGGGGALVSHPFLAKAAQRDPDGPMGFAQKHRRLFGDQDLETLGSLSPEMPGSKLQAKMWEIEDRQNLDVAYQDLLGMSRKDYEAKRLDAERMLDDFAFGLYTNSLDANNSQTKQLAQAYQSDKALRGIVDQYIKENKQDWDAMPDWRVGPEGRVPLKSEFEQPLVRERGGQQDNAEQEGFGSDLAFGDRQGVNKGKDDLTSSSGDFLTPAGGLPWKSAEASKRDNPNFDPAIIDETTNQFTEREMVRFLPVEGQQSYEAARKAGALPEWRRARQQEGDEWGAILNNQELRPVSLRTMLEEEYDTQDPERIAEIVQRDYLSNQNAIKGKDAAAKRAQYEADPLAYADDYMVVRKTRLPNLISGRDEFTPTERELIPEVRPRDAQAMQSKRAQAQALRSTYDEVLWDGFSDQEKGFLQEFGKLEDKFVDVGRKMPVEEKAKYRSLYQENKDLVDFYRTRRADLHELTKEAKALEKEAQNIDYQTKPVIDDFDPDKEDYVKGDKTNFQQTAAKRIPILVRDQRSGEWLKRSIDPMQLILQEQSQKGNFSKSPDTFIDEMANALHSGLAGILANPSLEVRLPTGRDPQTKKYTFAPDDPKAPKYIDPETIVYSRRNGGVQFKWKDLDAAPGFDRLKSALGSIREQKLKARDAEQRQSLGFAETDTIAKLRNYPEGADLIAQQSLAELPQRLEKEKMLRLSQRGLTAEQKQQIEAEYAQKLRDETGRIELQRLKDRARIEDRQAREEDETRFDSREMTAEVGTGAEWETGQAKTTPGNNKWSDDMPKEDQVYTFDKGSKRIPAEEVQGVDPGVWRGMQARAAREAKGLPGTLNDPFETVIRPEGTPFDVEQGKRRLTELATELGVPEKIVTSLQKDHDKPPAVPMNQGATDKARPVRDAGSPPIEGYADPRTLPPAEARLYAADSIRQQENPAAAAQGKREAMQRITRKFGDKPWIVRRELAKAEARYYYDMEVITERQEQARQAGQREPQPIEFDAEGNRKPRPVSEAPPTTPRIYAITLPSGRTRVATPEEADAINRTIQLQRGPNTAEEAPAAPTRIRLKDLQKIRQDEKKVGRAYIGPSGSKLAYYEFSPDTQSWETHEIPLVRGALDATTGSNTLKRQAEMNVTTAPDAPSSGAVTDPFGTEVPPGITATQPELRQGPTPGGVVSTAPPAYREAAKADTGPLRLGIKPQLGPPVPDPTSPTGLREGPRIHFDTGKLIFDPPPREEKPQGSGVAATGAYREGQAPQPPTPPQYEPLVINEDKVADYYGRTKISADKAEVTLAMAMDYGTAGEGLTKRLAGEKLVKWQPRSALTPFADAVVAQLKQSKGKTLNIAGNALGNWAKFTDKNKKPITQEHVNWAVYKVLKHIKENYPQLERVVTGGQTGTDIAGAIAARALGIPVEVNMPKGFRQEGQFSQTKDKVLRQIEDGAAKINQQLGEPANGLRTQEEQQAPDPAPAAVAEKPAEPSAPQPQPQLSATARAIRNKFVQSLKGKTPEQMRGVAAAKRAEAKTANDYKRQFLLTDADIAERMANGEEVKFSATLDIPGLTTDADLVRHQAAEAKLRRADLQREERFANELLKKLGLQRTVRLATVAEAYAKRPDKLGAHGMKWTDADGTVRVYLNPLLGKAVRLETLGHELGHIVFKDALSQADASTQKAVKQAFEAWRDGAKASRSLKAIYDSKKTAALLDSLWGFDGQTLDSLSAEDQAYVLDFEEWFADNVGRWMVSDAKPVGLVQQFFKDVADLLRDLFRLLHGNQPDAAVKRFMDSLFVREEPVILATTPGATSFTPAERKVLGQAFRAEHVQRQLRKLLENDPVALDQLRDPDAAIAYGYQFWLQGSLSVGPRTQTAFQRLLKATKDTLGEVDEGTQAEAILRAPGANVHKAQLTDTAVQRGYAKLKGQSAKLMEVLRKVAFMGHEQIKALDNPYTDRLAELIYNEAGTEGVAEGYLSAQVRQAGRFLDQLHNLFDGHDEALGQRVMDLATKRAPLSGANAEERRLVRGIYQLFADVLNYSKRAGVEPQLRGEDVTIDGETVRDYFPRVIDTDYLMAHKTEFLAMLNQPKYKDYVEDAEGIYRAYLENFGVESEFDPLADPSAPQASSFKKREFAWIEDEDIAPYLSRDLGEALSAYIYQTVKHSEWRRRFGGKDSRTYQQLAASKKTTPGQLRFAEQNGKYLDLLEDARATGLMPEQEERVTKYMEGMLGRLGTDINPTFNMLQSWMVVLQNWALLGMSAITSLADVAGLAVRGDIQVAWEGLKAGLNEVVALAKKDKTSLKALGEMLGTIERHTAVEALGFEYGGYRITEGARKWNDRLFRWNLLQSWTRGTRLMALASGKSFITKHVQNPGANSQRFLDQLNLRKGDVQFDAKGDIRILTEAERKAASEAELKRDDRVRAALNQFVDEAILRPNAAERPVYFNDPHYMLFSHLKQWVYSFQSVILRRVVSEAIEGNYMPMVRLMGYVPLTMAAIALKDAIKGDDEDKDWATRVGEGVERSGVLGYGQVFYDMMNDSQYGQMTGSSLMDPTSESMLDLLDALISAGSDDDVKAFERFLPLQSVWGG